MKVPHNALYQNCINGSAPQNTRVARTPDKKSFKWHLLNHRSKFKIISRNCSSWCLLPKLHKWFCSPNKGTARALDKKCLLMTFPCEPLVQIQNNFTELFLIMPLTKIAQMVLLHWTKGLPELQITNIFKRHILLNHWSKFKIISLNYSSWFLLPKLHKWFHSTELRGCQSSR